MRTKKVRLALLVVAMVALFCTCFLQEAGSVGRGPSDQMIPTFTPTCTGVMPIPTSTVAGEAEQGEAEVGLGWQLGPEPGPFWGGARDGR